MSAALSFWPSGYFDAGYFPPGYFGAGLPMQGLLPNPARTLRPVVPDYAGRPFLPCTPEDQPDCTFDFGIVEAADAPSALIDPSPAGRLVAGPAIDETDLLVTVRLGGFIAGATANYRLCAIVLDSNGATTALFSTITVKPRSDPSWVN
jgi:hypothetical protein